MTAAPTQPAALVTQEKPSAWPTVIGIIAITFASLAIFQNGICAPAGLIMTGAFSSMLEGVDSSQTPGMDVQAAQLDAVNQYIPHSLVMALVATAVAIVLLIGGIQLVKRKYKCRTTITAWAVLKMVVALPSAYLSYLSSQAQFEAMAKAAADEPAGPGQVPPGMFSLLESIGGVGAAVSLVWLWALPIFMLIWFARRPIQDEVRSWAGGADADWPQPVSSES